VGFGPCGPFESQGAEDYRGNGVDAFRRVSAKFDFFKSMGHN
jgi:hypothetical protein